MAGAGDLARMVPGFEFLQGLLKNAGGGLPNIGQWVAPTLDPEELDKRISELRTVQFWLEQNARLLATTIQALEVQRMTLSTLQTMNMPLKDLGEALKIKTPPPAPVPPPPAPRPPAPAPAPEPAAAAPAPAAPAAPAAPLVDPMQWWGALTQQFTEIAAKAVKDSAGEAAKTLASVVAAKAPAKTAAGKAATPAAKAPAKAARKAARKAAPRKPAT